MGKNIVIVTGASSGIGLEFVWQMDLHFEKIDEFWLIARNRDRLLKTAAFMRHKTQIFSADFTVPEQRELFADVLSERKPCVRMLINSAGCGVRGQFSPEKNAGYAAGSQLETIRLNCEALTHLTHLCIPYMKKGSRIIQMASGAAFLPQPGFAVYAATKSYVLSFSRALAKELKPRGIFVTAVCPGPVDTPFLEKAGGKDRMPFFKRWIMASPDQVVHLALKDSFYRRSLSVCGLPMKAFYLLTQTMPQSFILKALEIMQPPKRDEVRQ